MSPPQPALPDPTLPSFAASPKALQGTALCIFHMFAVLQGGMQSAESELSVWEGALAAANRSAGQREGMQGDPHGELRGPFLISMAASRLTQGKKGPTG